jgi:hypothetical protein
MEKKAVINGESPIDEITKKGERVKREKGRR